MTTGARRLAGWVATVVAVSLVVAVPPAAADTGVSAPPTPVVSSTDYPTDGPPTGGVDQPGVFTFSVSPARNVVAYAYTLDSGIAPALAPTVAATGPRRTASVTLQPTHDGVNTLRVWAKDGAGRFSLTPGTWTFLVSAPTDPDPGPIGPRPPVVTFPNGATAEVNTQLTVVFDAGGDTTVTAFRYSVDSTSLNQTVAPVTPGGTATVSVPAGASTGTHPLFVVTDDGTTTSEWTRWEFTVTGPPTLSGRVYNVLTSDPVVGAVVRLEPAGLQVISGPYGEFSFAGFEPGVYTLSATLDGPCPLFGSEDMEITYYGTETNLDVIPVGYEEGYTCPE